MVDNYDIVISGLSFIISGTNSITHNIPIPFETEQIEKIGHCILNLEKQILLNGPCQIKIIREYNILFGEDYSNREDTLFVFSYFKYINSII